jgi:hypothetical protein
MGGGHFHGVKIVEEWKVKARELRSTGMSIERISGIVRRHIATVSAAVADVPCDSRAEKSKTWKSQAVEMRQSGMKFNDIASLLRKSLGAVHRACRGIKLEKDVSWHDRAKELRASGLPIEEIAQSLGVTYTQAKNATSGHAPKKQPKPARKVRKTPVTISSERHLQLLIANCLSSYEFKPVTLPKVSIQDQRFF